MDLDAIVKRIEKLEAVAHEPVSIPIGDITVRLRVVEDALKTVLAAEPIPSRRAQTDQKLAELMKDLRDPIPGLVKDFSEVLLRKLRDAEAKYGYDNLWLRDPNFDGMRRELREHVGKGDPLDVAAYCAFLWYHGQSTKTKEDEAVEEGLTKHLKEDQA